MYQDLKQGPRSVFSVLLSFSLKLETLEKDWNATQIRYKKGKLLYGQDEVDKEYLLFKSLKNSSEFF